MDIYPIFLHSPEPSHLALCELVNGIGKKGPHLLECQDPKNVLRDELVLKSVVDKVLGTDSAVQKAFDFLDHPAREPLVKPSVYPGDPFLPADQSSDEVRDLRHKTGPSHWMFPFVHGDLQCPDYPSLGLQNAFVRKQTVFGQSLNQRLCVVLFKLLSELFVRRNLRQCVAAGRGLDVKPCPPAQDRCLASVADVFVGLLKSLLPLVEVKSRPGRHDVDKVVGNIAIFIQVLSGADVHPAIDLTGIG